MCERCMVAADSTVAQRAEGERAHGVPRSGFAGGGLMLQTVTAELMQRRGLWRKTFGSSDAAARWRR